MKAMVRKTEKYCLRLFKNQVSLLIKNFVCLFVGYAIFRADPGYAFKDHSWILITKVFVR